MEKRAFFINFALINKKAFHCNFFFLAQKMSLKLNNNISQKELDSLVESIIHEGYRISREEASALSNFDNLDALCDAADKIMTSLVGREIDSCSIVNARSGLCAEDCKWCSQASRHHTGCSTYNMINQKEALEAAHANEKAGVKRFSLVTSGKRVSEKDMPAFCDIYRQIGKETNLYLCASMGLLSKSQLEELKKAGVKRYHCNLETSEGYFPKLCTTHTPQEKKKTIKAAREAGMAICSGGIIGMGESMDDRLDLAFELRELDVDSVPINILNPIKGTPLESQPLISEEEVIRTVALFRFILPDKTLRFAGGRARLSKTSMLRILRGGMNGALMGDMLTSVGNNVAEDKELFESADMKY